MCLKLVLVQQVVIYLIFIVTQSYKCHMSNKLMCLEKHKEISIYQWDYHYKKLHIINIIRLIIQWHNDTKSMQETFKISVH